MDSATFDFISNADYHLGKNKNEEERRGRGWEDAISTLRSKYLVICILLLSIGVVLDFFSTTASPVIKNIIINGFGGELEQFRLLSFSVQHHVFRVLSIVFYTVSISVFVAVFVSNKIEKHERRRWENKVDDLRKSIAKNAFESLYNMTMPQELFDIIKSSIIEKKVIRKNANWDYRFEISPNGNVICKRTTAYEIHNIGTEVIENPVEFSIASDDNSTNELIHIIAKQKGETIARFDRDNPKNSIGLIISKDNTQMKVKLKGFIIPGQDNALSICRVDKTEYNSTVQDVFFTKLPIINGEMTIQYPKELHLFFQPSISSEFKLEDNHSESGQIIKRYQFSGGVLPNQGFALLLNRKTRPINMHSECLKTISNQITHRLRNAIGPAVGFSSSLIDSEKIDNNLKKEISMISNSCETILSILEELESFEDNRPTKFEKINLGLFLQDLSVSQEYKEWIKQKNNIVINLDFSNNVLDINGNADSIKKIIFILLNNLRNRCQTQSQTIEITIKDEYMDTPLKCFTNIQIGEYVVMSIWDNDLQLDKENLNTCFEPFSGHPPSIEESGLEMISVFHEMQKHSGYCTAESDVNGTIYKLYFPIYRHLLIPQKLSVPIETLKGQKQKVLIIDDEEKARTIATRLLTALDYEPYTVANDEEAIKLFMNRKQFDIILLDMVMPGGLDGDELYKKILDFEPKQKCIVISGQPLARIESKIERMQNLGAGRYLKKPFTIQELGETLKEELTNNFTIKKSVEG